MLVSTVSQVCMVRRQVIMTMAREFAFRDDVVLAGIAPNTSGESSPKRSLCALERLGGQPTPAHEQARYDHAPRAGVFPATRRASHAYLRLRDVILRQLERSRHTPSLSMLYLVFQRFDEAALIMALCHSRSLEASSSSICWDMKCPSQPLSASSRSPASRQSSASSCSCMQQDAVDRAPVAPGPATRPQFSSPAMA